MSIKVNRNFLEFRGEQNQMLKAIAGSTGLTPGAIIKGILKKAFSNEDALRQQVNELKTQQEELRKAK